MNPAERILRTLGRHLEGAAQVRLLGGAALVLGYGLDRATEDADLLLDDRPTLTAAIARASVPEVFTDEFPENCKRALALFD